MAFLRSSLIAFLALIATLSTPAGATIDVTVSAAGSALANVGGYTLATNNLDSAANGLASFGFAGSSITGTTTSGFVNIYSANVYGGAGGTGSFGTVTGNATLQLSNMVTYFGLWGSALDGNNTVALYNNDTLLGSYALQDTLRTVSNNNSAYYGNPFGGGNGAEQYAFFNFISDTAFNRVQLIQNGGGGFEFDNLTIGTVSAAPEPATWAMMLVGFAAIGGMLRSSALRRAVSAIVAPGAIA